MTPHSPSSPTLPMDDADKQTTCERSTNAMLSDLLNPGHRSDHARGDVPAPEDVGDTRPQQPIAKDGGDMPPGNSTRCAHGRKNCATCSHGGLWKCPHGREKRQCKECGGAGICPHGRVKSVCKECGGSGICPHGRRKSVCKECGGSAICPHRRDKRHCKECRYLNLYHQVAEPSRCDPERPRWHHIAGARGPH